MGSAILLVSLFYASLPPSLLLCYPFPFSRCSSFKKRAPRAVKEIKKFAASMMKTPDVVVDSDLNSFVWSKGIRNVPFRVRVVMSRQRREEEDAGNKFYTLVQVKDVESFKELQSASL